MGDERNIDMSLGGPDERFMREALVEAHAAAAEGEVPIGAVVVYEGEIIARAHNRRELDEDPSAHAEFSAMVAAARALGRWRLTGCTVYVTLEPCVMCAGLMVNARVTRCVYGAADPKAGALGSLYQLNADRRLNHAFAVTAGVLGEECGEVLRSFFTRLRGRDGAGNDAHDAKRDEARRGAADPNAVAARGNVGAPVEASAAWGSRASTNGSGPGGSTVGIAGEAMGRAAGKVTASADAALGAGDVLPVAPRVLLAVDSFKGSATSAQAEAWIAEGIRHTCPTAQITAVPIGDGGEGTAEALAASGRAARRTVPVHDAFGRTISATYLLWETDGGERASATSTDTPGGFDAFIEMASVAGLDYSDRTPEAAFAASTRGVGELVLDAVSRGVRTVYLGLGGSATNDGGAGFLQALGARLLDEGGNDIPAGLAGLERATFIDLTPAVRALGKTQFVALSDVTNPLVGKRGALRVFGPQKGLPAEDATLDAYDRWMVRYGALLDAACRTVASPRFRSLPGVPGAGAAGGLGAAVLALGGKLTPGIDAVLDRAGLDDLLRVSDFVITGEGLMDSQTADGKAPLGVARRARSAGVPVVAVVGGRADNLDAVYARGIDLVLPIPRRPMALDQALSPEETRANLCAAGETAIRAYLLR